ncbi:SGNH/GDSL hydrolase family protein [Sphingomonas montanisoli]|uniref:Uncharacterized protein n=1 Tax=Sphingomonas montanisoli TaxID=2606412 RepID=A0A5D9C6G6_9SPHN|nr:SGNH/GDSL hydrolase family protein [Sphingomonas montanisoli]TZG25585.1 hypothetical protein FYJ91_11195 [Sphingomonas montanisoli]
MALGALSLSVTSGVQGRPFQAKINGLTTGKVEVLNDGAPGFSTVNGNVMSSGLPYPVSTVVLREYEPGVGDGYRDTRIDIQATTQAELDIIAANAVGSDRSVRRARLAGDISGGALIWSLLVEDDLGATRSADVTPFPLLGASVVTDFANDRYAGGSFASLITFSRTGPKTDLTVDNAPGYAFRTFEDGVPAISPGRGALMEHSATNLFLNSGAPVTQAVTVAAATWYTLWIADRAELDGSATISEGTATFAVVPADNTWGAVGGRTALHGKWVAIWTNTAGTVNITVAGSPRAVQFEAAAFGIPGPTSYVPSTGSAGVRNADNFSTAAGFLAALAGASGTMVVRSRYSYGTPNNGALVRIQSGAPLQRGQTFTQGLSHNNQGGNEATYSLGEGNRLSSTLEAVSWSATDRRVVANGGSVKVSTKLQQITTTAARLGFSNAWQGWIERIDVIPAQIADTQMRPFTTKRPAPDIAVYGDSLVSRASFPGGRSIPQHLAALTGKRVLNCGAENDQSTAIRTRFLNDALFDREIAIMAGRNNYSQGATVQADIAAMVAAIPHDRYLVLSVANINTATEFVGTANYDAIVALNAALAATYGARFLNVWQAMIDAYDPAEPMEVQDFANKVVPWRFRQISRAGTLVSDINNSATTFACSEIGGGPMKFASGEYVNVLTRTTNVINTSERGYLGTTAAAHTKDERYEQRETTHYSDAGRIFIAQQIAAKRATLGW